jgi:hypothetical protein
VRRVITGLDAAGRSCVVSDEVIETTAGRATAARDRGTLCVVWETRDVPPSIDRPRSFALHPSTCVPGGSKWMILGWEPNVVRETVRTNTLDYDTVLEGSCDLLLETGSVSLDVGDSAVIPGTVHGWRAGPRGVVLSVVLIGLDPDDDGSTDDVEAAKDA